MPSAQIMIVEDEQITAEYLRDILTDLGYGVTAVVSNSMDAIRRAEEQAPDLVLMDIRIKGEMDGTETARQLRERFDIPVIYLTAHADPETLEKAKLAEPLGYIVKPFQESDLPASIEMALHKQNLDRRRREQEQHLSSTLSGLEQGIITTDGDGLIRYINPAAEALTGWCATEAKGQRIEGVFRATADSDRPVTDAILRALHGGELAEVAQILIPRSGKETTVSGTVAPVRNEQDRISGAILIFSCSSGGLQESATGHAGRFEIICESDTMKAILNFARRVSRSDVSTILIEGESGTGKDIVAKYLHYQSSRHAGPFLAINCAAIPETLLESELFGYEKGAFTDARTQKRGIFEVASGGTVFLDEIGELPLLLQAKLLRVLEEQSFRRLGGTKDICVDLRIIAATNRPLINAIQQNRFRLDLYYRLNVIQITIPPLRERHADILPLVSYFLRSFNVRFHRDIKGLTPDSVRLLLAHAWPGNVRELRNIIERAMVLEDDPLWIRPSSLGIQATVAQPVTSSALNESSRTAIPEMPLEEAERLMLVQALERAGWNQTHAAQLLGITRDTLRYRMKKFSLSAPAPDQKRAE